VDQAIGSALAAFGPWGVLIAVLVTGASLVAKGRLIPRSLHDQRMADKQQLIDFYEKTTTKALDAVESREQRLEGLIEEMTKLAADMRTGRV
jgi:hypothetical protein